jgi:hypothetical protein
MKTKKTIEERFAELKEKHPNVDFSLFFSHDHFDRYRLDVKVVEGYTVIGNKIYRRGWYDIEAGYFSAIGIKRKLTELENMDWTKLDEIGCRANKEYYELMKQR